MRRKHRRWPWVVVALVVAAALLAVLGVKTGRIDNPFDNTKPGGPTESVMVDASGGTYAFPGGITITVPEGAVTAETALSVGEVTELRPEDEAPFMGLRSGAVRFDVTLSRGDNDNIQLVKGKPLGIEIPLEGAFAPKDGSRAYLYTPGKTDGVYELVSATMRNEATVLRGSLSHLSPKWVTYVSDQALLDSFYPNKVEGDRDECKQKVTVDGDTIKIGGDSRGWSLEDDSPIFACLYEGSDGYVRVGINNRIGYILSVAATSDVRLAPSRGNAEEEVVKVFAGLLFPNDKIDAYAGVGGELVGSMRIDELPSTMELRGDPNTFLAEGAWRAISLLVGIFTGTNSSENAQMVETVVESVEVVSCLQDMFSDGSISWDDTAKLVFECSTPIVDALSKYINVDPFKRLQYLWGAVGDVYQTITGAVNGVKLTLNNTMRIEVVPPPSPCPSDEEIKEAVYTWYIGKSTVITEVRLYEPLACQDNWASLQVGVRPEGYEGPNNLVGFSAILHREAGLWTIVTGGQDMSADPVCDRLPPKVKGNVYCG